MNTRSICNNVELINKLCKEYMNLDITDSNYKVGFYNSSSFDLYITYLGQNYIIRYNDESDNYILFHRSLCGYDARKIRYHKEWSENGSIEKVIYKLSTRHNPKDMYKWSSNRKIVYTH